MLTYTIRRLVLSIPTLLFISIVIFLLLQLAPGDPMAQVPLTVPPEVKQKMREALGKAKTGEFDLKHSPGGIVDIEFMVQYGVLAFAHQYPALMDWTDNIRILERLSEAGVMSAEYVAFLCDAYRAYRGRLHRLKLQEQSGVVPDTEFVDEREGVQRIWSEWLLKNRS